MVPVPLRLFFRSRADTVVVDISGSEVVVLRCGERTCDEIGRFPAMAQSEAGGDDEAPVKLALASAGAARQRTALRLSATQALRRSINLPAAAETPIQKR